jgi:hypothetical protein
MKIMVEESKKAHEAEFKNPMAEAIGDLNTQLTEAEELNQKLIEAKEKAEQELARTKAELNAKLTEAYVTAEKQHAKQSGKSSSEECETAVAA